MKLLYIYNGLITYIICGIPFGVLVSRFIHGKDVRSVGSGNIGATNVSRLMGKKWGIIVLILDAYKGYFCGWLLTWRLSNSLGTWESDSPIIIGAVLGHCFSVFLKFKGGKGVATALGIIALFNPIILPKLLGIFFVSFIFSRRISVGSCAAAISLPFLVSTNYLVPYLVVSIVVIYKHRENVRRLFLGEEPRFF